MKSTMPIADPINETCGGHQAGLLGADRGPQPPLGGSTRSPDDVKVTEQIVQAGKLLDHPVIGQQCYVSLQERGRGFA